MAMSGGPPSSLKRKLDTAGIDVRQDDDRRDRCYKCGGRGHMQKECSSDPKAGSEQSCYKCQGKGHFARSCPNLSRDVCYFCGTMGHHGLDCPLITRMFGNLPPIKRKELMSKMHANPQFANMVMREANMSAYSDPYSSLLAGGNPLQALMALLQQQGIAAPGGQALYANPYNQQSTQSQSGYAGYESQGWPTGADASQASNYASAYGAPPSPSGGVTTGGPGASGYGGGVGNVAGAASSANMYGQTTPNPFGNAAEVLRALASGAYGGAAAAAAAAAASSGGYGGYYGGGVGGGNGLGGLGGGVGGGLGLGGLGGGPGAAAGNCFKCGQAGHFARECPNAPADGGVLCYRCGQSGHMAKECTNPPITGAPVGLESCFRCGERGHFSRDCVKNGAVPSKDACFKCGQPGHRTRECTGQDIRVCFVCKQSGHVSSNCPDRAAR